MDKGKFLKLFHLITGIVFLLSGIGKITDVTAFAFLIDAYGLSWAVGFAPLIVVGEIAVGVLLILGIQLRRVSLVVVLMLIAFTIAYGYGYWMHGVENCGCFGVMSRGKTPFWSVFLRNTFLIYFMVETYRRAPPFEPVSLSSLTLEWKRMVAIFVTIAAAFLSGLTYCPQLMPMKSTEHKMIGKSISEVAPSMNEFLSSDSSYVAFVFSYTCPHCWNSIENLKQYANFKVIGITTADTTNRALFYEQFNPQFPIRTMPSTAIESFIEGFPTTFYIKNGCIRQVIEGELPCLYFFKESL